MIPLPARILVPTTANRIPWTENAQNVVTRLLDFQINASAFLTDAERMDDLRAEGFENDFDRAFEDLFYQIPKELWREVFPVEVANEEKSAEEPTNAGRTKPRRVAV